MEKQSRWSEQRSERREHVVQQQEHVMQQQRTEHHYTHQTMQQVESAVGDRLSITSGRPGDPSPPIFEQIFKNARFAQGGNAKFEGKLRGNPIPTVSWTRKKAPLVECNKYSMSYNEQTGDVSLLIKQIGPGDEGEYTCTARNQYGEAICSVYIQPEGVPVPTQPASQQQSYRHVSESVEHKSYGTQGYTSEQTRQSQKYSYTNGSDFSSTEDFKVDTFEYRLLREVSFRETITKRHIGESDVQINTDIDKTLGPVSPPKISQKPRNSKLQEGADAQFQVQLSGNPRPRVSWFKNGQRLINSNKHNIITTNNQTILRVRNIQKSDSGHYTLLAENPNGCIVTSAYLVVESPQETYMQEQKSQYTDSQQVETERIEISEKALAPQFVKVCQDRDVTEGKMTRFDCRVTGRPYPEVTWFINDRQIRDDYNHKILVNESGNHALMITNVSLSDSGIVTCVARNKSGETSFQCRLNVIEKEQVVAPKFVKRFSTFSIREGEPVQLSVRAVGTPTPRITWQKDGVPIIPNPELRIQSEGGASTLDIPRAKASDAAWYQCTAQNVAGSTATRARLYVEVQKEPVPEQKRLHLPRPTKVIEPEPAPGPEIIYLRHVERARPYVPPGEEDRVYPPPQFIVPLKSVTQMEGGKIHFETRIEPVGDPSMKIEWLKNGQSIEASSRFTSVFRFGYISLDMLSLNIQDSGEYTCRAISATGMAETKAILQVTPRATIERTSQHPESLQYLQQFEDYSKYQHQESVEEQISQRPQFIRPLQDLGQLQEGRNAHFEAQLTPVSDPTMRVEWYKDGKAITASSRITAIFNFGYVSLNIMHLRAEDAGSYTVRAVNRLGEAISTASIQVAARSTVTADLGIPEQRRYIEKTEQLEAYQHQQQQKYYQEVPESTQKPEFKTPIKDQINIKEGGFAHFEARLEPVGDSTLKVEWLKDGRPVEASSRITTFFNFGYVALTIKSVTVHDAGHYTCQAYNALGQAATSANLSIITKKDIIAESQHPGGLEKIQYLEDSSKYSRRAEEEVKITQKPRFLGPLKGTNKIVEGQSAHFEARVEPQSDLTMIVEWYFNGKQLKSANRIQTYHDFGYVALDISNIRSEDSGLYTVVARNAAGEAQLSSSMVVETRSSIDTSSIHHGLYEKTKQIEESKFVEPMYHIEEISKSKPVFVQPLSDPQPVSEGKNIHLECRLEPMGDPTMRVEWFHNGRAVTVGSRFKTYYDFGFVALDIIHATSFDSGEYTARAVNHLGSAHTSAMVRVIERSDILTDTQNEQAVEQIQILEDAARRSRQVQEDITVMQAPHFSRALHNIETVEGTNVHLECRLQPVGDPTMKVEWFCNGRPIKTGHRFRPAYEFDYVALDLLSVYPEDSGVYTCQATNQLGEAVTSCALRVLAKRDLIFDSQHPSSLEKMQYLEDSSRYKKSDVIDEFIHVKPRFVTKPKSIENVRERNHVHFECKLEPVTDPNLKVEWFKNGQPVTIGHRFRPIHDFGYVALDIIDLIAEDSGIYTCRAVNLVGTDEVSCRLSCRETADVIRATQNEAGLEQIQVLEDRSRYHRTDVTDEVTTQAPIFTTSLKNVEIKEGQRAHFECRLIPVSDATMKVEWYHNNKPLKSGSRFTETNNFGFVALDIMACLPEDSGTYTCRAINALGEAVTSGTAVVHSKKSIYLESQHEGALPRLNQLEDSSRYHRQTVHEETITQAPVFTMPMKDIKIAENQAVHFEARLIPVGDPKLRVEWLRNGVPIEASNRITTMHDFGYVALNMKYVNPEDSGTYTCRAINELGEAVTSSTLFVQSKASLQLESQHEVALQKIQQLEDTSRYQRREEVEVAINQAPRFVTQLNGPTKLVEGQSAHYECRIEPYPDPNMRVEWYFNGKVLQSGHRYRTAYDFGFAALDILTVYGEDSGEYTCKVINNLGQATSSVRLNVQSKESIIRETQHESALEKIQYLEDDSRYKRVVREEGFIAEKPQFGKPLKNVHVPEGQPVHLEATLTPVNDPTMRVEWYCNGRPIQQGHRFKTTYDFGYVALDVLYAYAEDSGTYMCKATNALGEAVTTSSVNVDAKASLYLETLDEQRLKKIKELEQYERPRTVEEDMPGQRPVFLTALTSIENLKEGDRAHFECRVEPINDPDLKIEWFINGQKIKTGHRFRTTHDFGYVALDILYSYAEDSGTYMCKATNKLGEAVNTCTLKVASHRSIILDTHHPNGLEKIRQLEAQGHQSRIEVEEPKIYPPRFVTELRGTTHVFEGQTAHFECQVEPVHDPNLRIEFYHNGKALQSASRFHITFDFGYVSLDIQHCVPEDAGEYSVKAINALGQCTSSISMTVTAKGSIISESQRPEGLDKIRELESAEPFKRPEIPEPVTRQRPVFTQPLQNIDNIQEGQTAHFDCRLIPVGDPTLKVEWFRNEKLIEDSSRITKTHDFGYVSMTISHVRDEDEGVYMCRASNLLGEAVTTAAMRIKTKAAIQMDTQHPEGMRKIQKLEEPQTRKPDEPEPEFEKPIFTQVLTGPSELWEGQHAHYEARVVPVGDPSLRFEWYINGVELKMGSRFRTTHDFGFVTLDINSVVANDAGVYMCKAINRAGSTVSSTSLKVKTKSTIIDEAMRPESWQQIQLKEAAMNKVPEMFVDTGVQQAPIFTTHLKSYDKLVEGQHVYLEAQVEPRTDPNLRIEWFKNGISLTTGSRLKSTFDFGLVTLSINSVRIDDSGIYTCKATNLMGEAVSTASIKIEDRHWLLGESLHPESLDRIGALEQSKPSKPESPEPVYETPVFISHLNNIICKEGDNIHFECNVEPSRDPTLKIEWFFNNKPLPSGTRYKSTHDFGYVSLDVTHTYEEDSGIYTCKATNSKGFATTSGTLRCTGDKHIYLDTQHPQGKAGLEAVEQAEEARLSKGRRPSVPEAEYPKPEWVVPVTAELQLIEGQALHLEGQVIPKNDPDLKIEWYFNGKILEQGSRFKLSSDFGFVTLDVTDVYERDSGIYTCKAYNKRGEAFTSSTIYCISKENLIERTQHPKGAEGLEKIQNLEESLRREPAQKADDDTGRPPEFVTVFQDITDISEGQIAHYEASLIPTGDQSMLIEWFYNGKTIEASHRIRTVYAFGMVVLEILGTKTNDSGIYSCRATNRWGQAEISVRLECIDKTKGQKPRFTSHIQNIEGLKDGQSAHFECTVVPVDDPDMKIEWYHNGHLLRHSTRIKTISDFGFVVLDIAYTQNHDSGEYVCRAYNKYGEDFTKATISCYGRSGVFSDSLQPESLAKIRELESLQGIQQQAPTPTASVPPKFITPIEDVTKLVEGQSAHFEARLIPVDDPDLKVEWFYNGKKLPHGHRYRTFHDFGIVILDILYCYEENSGEYECVAVNKLGRDSTKATLKCTSKENLILDSQLPRGMEGGLEKLQTLEDSMIRRKDTEIEEKRGKAPVFTVPLSNIDNLREGENAHFEARLTPTDDPDLKVEWYWNGKSLKAGSRFRTFCDFGFVILEISPTYPEDSGEYLCRAYNNYGEAVTTASMKVQGKRNIILESQLPKGMEGTIDKIAALEGYTGTSDALTPEAESGKPPEFITTPSDLILSENSSAHFECRLVPINDSSMIVEWFHNGKPLLTGSRVKTINDFGFVILEIGGIYQRDAGLYTCKATNRHGEATVSCKLQVKGRQGIILEPQLPSHFKSGTESIQKLEETLHKREEITIEDEKPNPPRFTVEIKDNLDVSEGGPIHFDCRVEPVGDPTMRIDWFHNGRPFATGSRVHMLNDFGFIALDVDYIYTRDVGEYTCRATNKWGSATTTAKVTCSTKRDIVLESQLPQGMSGEKIKELERGRVSETPKEDSVVTSPPKFITQIQSHTIEESESVRFECRVEPKEDPKLRIEWYRNGKLLPTGHRFRTVYDMGFVSLDILYVYAEDSGEYVCRAVNDFGEDFTKATVSCKKLPDIILQNQVPKGMKRSEALTQMEATIKKYTSEVFLTEDDLYDADKKQPPRFVTQIQSQTTLVEMETTKFECQLAPVGDPNMKVEWFFNGKPLLHKNRFTPIYDFGYVAMNFGWVYPEDSGEYLCRATNLYGMDETRAVIKTTGKPGIVYDSQLPKHMKSIERIREMEASWQVAPEQAVEETKPRSAPVFVSRPEPVTVEEGEWARFCCRVTGHPKPRVMWLINGNTIVNGSRYKLTYDGMYHLDIPKTRQYDTGKIEVIARSSVGEALAITELKVIPRHDDYRSVLKNAPRRIIGTKGYRKPEWVTQMEDLQAALKANQAVPTFIQQILGERVRQDESVTFEAVYGGNPIPEIIWYKDDEVIKSDKNYIIEHKDNRTICEIRKAKKELEGIYKCKAVSDIGMAITKASLQVFEAEETFEKIPLKRTRTLKTDLVKEKKVKDVTEEALTCVTQTLAKEIESSEPIPEKPLKTEKAILTVNEADSLEVVDTATLKKVVEKKNDKKQHLEKIEPVVLPKECLVTSEEQADETVKMLSKFVYETQKGITKTVEEDKKMVAEINELLQVINAKEFGPGESPLRELAKIGYMLRSGVTTEQIESLYDSECFPALRAPQSQSALVQLVERQGHGALITEVLTHETTQGEDVIASKVGFKAFMKMVEMRHSTVEEVITHLYPQDFEPRSWEVDKAQEVLVKSSAVKIAKISTTSVLDNKQDSQILSEKKIEDTRRTSLSSKSSDVEESEEIVTKFMQAPGNKEPIKIKTKRTIIKKKNKSEKSCKIEGDIVIEETIDDDHKDEIIHPLKHDVQIEEYDDKEMLVTAETDQNGMVELPEEEYDFPKLKNNVSIQEIENKFEDVSEETERSERLKVKTKTPVTTVVPEEVQVSEVKSETGEVQNVKTTKRVIKKNQGEKQEVTEITTVEKKKETPVTIVSDIEEKAPEEKEAAIKPIQVVEFPEETTVQELQTTEGKFRRKRITKRIIKKRVGPKVETTQIITEQDDEEKPITTVQTTEEFTDETITPLEILLKSDTAKVVEEVPTEVKVAEVKTETGKSQRVKTTKRVIKKKQGNKQEVTEITTVEKEGETPVTTVSVAEEDTPKEEKVEPVEVVELPEEISVEEVETPEGKPKHKKITKRIIKKKVGPKIETTQITTEQEDDKTPVIKVHTTQEVSDEILTPIESLHKPDTAKVVEEVPEEVKITEVRTATGDIQKIKTTKRVIKKKQGPKQEVTEITTVEKEGETPVTTVSVAEEESPKEEKVEPVEVVELPEEISVEEVETPEDVPEEVPIKEVKTITRKKIRPKKVSTEIEKLLKDGATSEVIGPDEETFESQTVQLLDKTHAEELEISKEPVVTLTIDKEITNEISDMKKPKKVLKPQKIERIELKVDEAKFAEELAQPQFSKIKLKKPMVKPKQEPSLVILPKVQLKSRVKFITDWPPKETKPIVAFLGSVRQNGELSRNVKEAAKLKKKAIKTPKLPEFVKTELEKPLFTYSDIVDNQNQPEKDTHEKESSTITKDTIDEKPNAVSEDFNDNYLMEEPENFTITPRRPSVKKIEELTDEVTIKKKLKPVRKSSITLTEITEPEEVTFRPKVTKTKEDVEQEFNIQLDSYAEEEISMSSKVKLKQQRQPTFTEEADETSIKFYEEENKEGVDIVEIIDEVNEEDKNNEFILPLKKTKSITVKDTGDINSDVTVSKPKPVEQKTEFIEDVTFDLGKQRKYIVDDQEISFDVKQQTEILRQEELNLSSNIKLAHRKKGTISEAADTASIIIEKEIKTDTEVDEIIISDDEIESNVEMVIKRKPKKQTYEVSEVEELSVDLKPKKPPSETFEGEQVTISTKRKPKKPSKVQEAEASMSIAKEQEFPDTPVNVRCGDTVFAVYSYVAETGEAINLVEGERLYILETTNQDWWFVRKHLTEEKGWVPAQYLMDEANYTLYLQKKLNEKIDKLPVFEKPASEEQAIAPIFVEKLRPKHTPDGSTVQFECQVEGYPRPQITWFRQTAIIKPSQDFQMYYDDDNVATLVIREVFPEDAGTFTCVAKNAAGFASSTAELTVEAPLSDHGSEMTVLSRKSLSRESSLADILEGIPPTFSKRPKAQYVDEGSNIFLECRLVAIPEPDIAWFFKGEEVMPSEFVSVTTESDMHMYCSVLKITDVKKFQEGTYTVLAVNREGEASLPIVLKIRTGEKDKPQVIEPLKSMTIKEGESVVLSTQVVGSPEPKVTWFKNNKPVKSLTQKSDGDIHTITIVKPVKGKDDGVYSLRAINSEGSAETSAVIIIEESTEENAEPPLFVIRFQEITVKEKGTIKLHAKVTGNPVPTITWYRNNQIITPNETVSQNFDGENIDLIIENVDSEVDSGDYKCVAANSAGKASHGARVTIDVDRVTFIRNLKKRYVTEEGKTVNLQCETSHTVSTKWYHNDKELSGMDHREIIQEGRIHKLRIKKTKLTDKGIIKCIVKGQETKSELVVNETIPEFLRKLQDFEVKERDIAILEVEISSETADVVWEKDGRIIKPKKNKYELEKRGNVRKLFIRNTSVHDEGEYTCKLRDDACTAEVTVVELPPEIISRLQDQRVNKGNKATFEIELTKGDALVRWLKDGSEIQFSNHMQLTIDGKKQKLKIYDCDNSDAGDYACEVGNDRCTAQLVVDEPTIDFIMRLPEVVVVPANTDAQLMVEIPDDNLIIVWYRRKTVIEDSEKFTLISDGRKRTLIIRKCLEEDQCDYSCELLDTRCTTKLKVEVIEFAPKIISYEPTYRVRRGGSTTIEVEYSAHPPPHDIWTRENKPIKRSKLSRPSLLPDAASLTLHKLDTTHSGKYTITLINNVGEATADINLVVLDISSRPGKPGVLEVDDTWLNIFWSEPDDLGGSSIECYIVEYQEENTTEWISKENVKKTQYCIENLKTKTSYRFRVLAVNEVGVSEASELTDYILIKKASKPQAPTVEKPLRDIIGEPNDDVELTCIFGGIPEPKVIWYRNGKQLKTAKATYINRVASLIVTATKTTEGNYKCVASNTLGEVDTSCILEIRKKPVITISEEEIKQKHAVGEEWQVSAFIEGIPTPDIEWYKDDMRIVQEIEVITEETTSVIRIKQLRRTHSGKYTIKANNKAGSTSINITLKVYDKPSKPEGPVIMKEISRESVTIEWKPPLDDGGLELIKYAIEKLEPEIDKWVRVADVDKNIESYCIQRLSDNCEYMFRVLAQNPVGVSEALESDPIIIKNALDVPSPPLGPLGIFGVDSDRVTISWYPSERNGGTAIIDYSIEVQGDDGQWSHVATSANTFVTITKLRKNTSYQFRICARNEIGISLPYISDEKVIIGKTLSAPGAPASVIAYDITSRSVTLRWTPPFSDGGSPLTNYIIEYKAFKTKWSKVVTVSSSLLQYCVEHLKHKDELLFRVSAENAIGVGPPTESETVRLEKHASVPSPPTGPLEIRMMGTNITCAWGTPEWDGGSPLLGYNIAIRDVTKTMWMEVGKVHAGTLKFNIRDLGEDHTYMIRIYARNEIGLSEPLEPLEPLRVVPCEDSHAEASEVSEITAGTEPTSFSQPTSSWLRDHNMDADIRSYARGSLLRRDEYFFRIWLYAKQLFK